MMQFTLDNFDPARFLREYWQKRPLLLRNPWSEWENPIEPEELAGLACEADVESRLVTLNRGTWSLEHGPLPEERFASLGPDPWTLLVQSVDHRIPAVAALVEPFRFVPDWRIDDVMVSFAVTGGGVGPHFDQYDVFLVQGQGRRRWQVGGHCSGESELLPHPDLRLLAQFEAQEEWVLEPGDILYLPPGLAHDGIALTDDCMTYSIGFRAPSLRELVANWSEYLVADMEDDERYRDGELASQANPGEIAPNAIAGLQLMIAEKLLDRGAFAEWFGRYSTMSKYPEIDWRPEEPADAGQVGRLLGEGIALLRNPASRFACFGEGDQLQLFVDGQCYRCAGDTAELAARLCAEPRGEPLAAPTPSGPVVELVTALIGEGCLAFDLED